MSSPRRLSSKPLEKIWGSRQTEPWHTNSGNKQIGEVWFEASDAVPLLVKFLFTSDKLSVQVHPEDAYAAEHHQSRGKTEMWHILRAEPDAQVALGLKEETSPENFRAACECGQVINLLNWVPARAGDTFFTPAGTVHAIGGGLALCEIQQLSDITYRLYDYGRPGRELHLDHGLKVAHLHPHNGLRAPVEIADRRHLLAECEYFRTERLRVSGSVSCPARDRISLYIVLEGEGTLNGARFSQGEAWEVAAGSGPLEIESPGAIFLITSPSTSF